MKKSLNARIDPELSHRLDHMKQETGKTKTSCLETALTYYFENCQDLTACPAPPANPELVQAIREALQTPEIINVLRMCITQKESVIHDRNTQREPQKEQSVIHDCNTLPKNVIQDCNTDDKVREALEIVRQAREVQTREGCNIDQACKIAGFSNKKYYNRVKFLKSQGVEL